MIACPPALENYPGAKNTPHVWQTIINHIPPHKYYFELFAGSAAVYRHKKPAAVQSYLIDKNVDVIMAWRKADAIAKPYDALEIIPYISMWCDYDYPKDIFVYMDPPYRHELRPNSTRLYGVYEMDDTDHQLLLSRARKVKYNCLISHYPDQMYDDYLHEWSTVDIDVMYNGYPRVERLYMNYPTPTELHEYTYLGADCWDRQRIKRKIQRRVNTLMKLPPLERNAIVEAIRSCTDENNCNGQSSK